MPTTRHSCIAYHSTSMFGPGISFEEADARTQAAKIDTSPWEPKADDLTEPIEYGLEVLSQHRFPDGTPLHKDEKIWIAAVALQGLREN